MAYSSITKPTDYFNTVLYSGTGSDQSVTGTGFTADWIWLKERNGTDYHFVNDSVRGKGSNNHYLNIFPNDSAAEVDQTTGLNAINSNGFDITYRAELNESGKNYVAWNWKAGGSASSNSDGTITSSVSANTTAGFSIVSYTGNGTDDATVGHGLSQKPDMVIIKARENTSSWATWHKKLTGSDYLLFLDATDAQSQYTTILKNQSSTVLTLGTNSATNASGQGFIAYCFSEKKGYSKFGSYTGNGNADGTFVYTGFLPAFVLIKSTASSTNWPIIDNKRPGYNPANAAGFVMFANTTSAESSSATRGMDFNSNGFKIRGTNNDVNGSSNEITYMAFAKNPFVGNDSGTAVPVTAG